MFGIMGKGGGYVLGAVHNVQPDVPPENVLALYEAGRRCVYAPPPATGRGTEGGIG
jgi:hypothetical protein